jgi:tetratricopeptide (TPR) repeat protein
MADQSRIDDLRRRVQKDPASIAFAQLAEECRRAEQHQEAVDVCRAGLAIHPGYLSARVTLGRALIELDQLDEAQSALELVLKSAPENLAAIRGLAEIHHRRGSLPEALAQYRAALALARNDPDLQQTVAELARKVEPPKPPASADGLSFEQVQSEFLQHSPPPPRAAVAAPTPVRLKPDATNAADPANTTDVTNSVDATSTPAATDIADVTKSLETDSGSASADPFDFLQDSPAPPLQSGEDTAERQLALQTIAALEQWLDAIHVTRAQRIA